MAKQGLFHISLAAKCRMLFGSAVVLIIAAALFVPWYAMGMLVDTLNVQRARYLAMLGQALVDPAGTDWEHQQALLNQWWNEYARQLELPDTPPKLILIAPPAVNAVAVPHPGELLANLEQRIRLIRKAFRPITRYLPNPPGVEVPGNVWRSLPETYRKSAMKSWDQMLARLVPTARKAAYPTLDVFQKEAIERMQLDETIPKMARTEHVPGRPAIYRHILPVRKLTPGSTRPALVGIIDMRLPVLKTDQTLLITRVVIIVAGLLAGFLAILVFYLVTQKLILAPVRELKGLAEQITAGDLTARSAINTGDEYEDLAAAFNNMLTQLERSHVDLETINRSLDTRLGELAETNVALFESNRLKSEFLANVSHELRTPLTSIIGFADLLRDTTQSTGPIDATRAARYANNILTSGRMLLDIINDLLDLAKIEAGKVELHRTTFSVRDVCESLTDFMRPLADKKNLALTLTLDEQLPMLYSDAGKIRQVLYNLLSNAIKYTQEGGTVQLEVEVIESGRGVRLSVADNGPGIAPEHHERIFEKFRQLDASVTREHSGTGLGLPISRELCIMLGGTLHVESEIGQGARFIIELPLECPETARRAMPSLT